MEVEAKFTIPNEIVYRRLSDCTELAGYTLAANRTVPTRDQYYDTADGGFLAAGYACRLRAEPDVYIVTLKSLGDADGAVHRRDEREVNLPYPDMDPTHWPDGPARWLAVEIANGRALQPLFELSQERARRNVMDGERQVGELSVDRVELSAARTGEGASTEYFELETELKGAGTEDDLARLVDVLSGEWGLTGEKRSKFERALDILREHDPVLAALPVPGAKSAAVQLTQEERHALERYTADAKRPLARRAAAVLGWAAGQSSIEISKAVGLSAGRVRYWVRSFRSHRMAIFAKGAKKRGPKPRADRVPAVRSQRHRERIADTAAAASATQATEEREAPPLATEAEPQKTEEREAAAPSEVQAESPVERPLDPADPMSEAGRKVMYIHFGKVRQHEEGTRSGEDPESLHDMRVATRRLRAAYLLFEPYFDDKVLGRFNKRLRKTGRVLGAVRDLDVLLMKLERYRSGLPEEEAAALDPLVANWHSQRDEARAKMIDYLDSGAYSKFRDEFGEFLETPGAGALPVPEGQPVANLVRYVIPRLILERYEDVRAYELLLPGAPLKTYHELRITCKKLRYAMEFFKDVLGDGTGGLIKKVVTMQDLLGDLQDATVAEGLLASFLAEQAQQRVYQANRARLEGISNYLSAQWATQRDLLGRFPNLWSELVGYDFRKALSVSVAAP